MRRNGFTLLEIVLAAAVGGLIVGAASPAIYQVVQGSAQNNGLVVARTNVSQATVWIRDDLQMAQSTNLIDGNPTPQSSVTLTWTDYTGWATPADRNHSSAYTLSGVTVLRNYDGTITPVGREITSLGFTLNGRVVTVVITARGPGVPSRTETLKFSVLLRPVPPP